MKFNADWPQLRAGHQWVLSTLRRRGIDVRPDEFRYTVEPAGQYQDDRKGVTLQRLRVCARVREF